MKSSPRLIAAGCLLAVLIVGLAPIFASDGESIVREADRQLMGDRYYGKSEIRTYKNGIAGMSITFETYSMHIAGELRSLSVYLAPAIMKGTAYLVAERTVWARFGLTGRVREMGKDALSDSADGTDFGYYDLGETSGGLAALYTARTLSQRVRSEGQWCFEVELTPKVGEKISYDRVVAFIANDSPRYIRIDYYRDGALLKHLTFDEYKRVGFREYPFAYTMFSDTHNSRTEVRTVEVKFDSPDVTADMFTVDYLRSMSR